MSDKQPKVEICIPTRNRYEFLALLLHSITLPTYDNFDVLIIDDSDKPLDITTIPFIAPFLQFLKNNMHEWRVFFGEKKGPHKSHDIILKESKANYILRVDDDQVMNADYVEKLMKTMLEQDHCGAVGGLVLNAHSRMEDQIMPKNWKEDKNYSGEVWEGEDGFPYHSPGLQWVMHEDNDLKEVQHLHSSFLYRKAAGLAVDGWSDMDRLSPKGHNEETWFTYKLYLSGWKMFVNPEAVIWHLCSPYGGIRADADMDQVKKRLEDDLIFSEWYKQKKAEIQNANL